MGYWNSRGLRGNDLEEQINFTNDYYREKKLALVQKIPTPIKPINMDSEKHVITLAYFDQKSTVDYIGIVQGIPICFDAKETNMASLPLANIHEHQIKFMKEFKEQGGIAFLLVYFKRYDEYYFLPIEDLEVFYNIKEQGGRKSIKYDDFKKEYQIFLERGVYLHYLEVLSKYVD